MRHLTTARELTFLDKLRCSCLYPHCGFFCHRLLLGYCDLVESCRRNGQGEQPVWEASGQQVPHRVHELHDPVAIPYLIWVALHKGVFKAHHVTRNLHKKLDALAGAGGVGQLWNIDQFNGSFASVNDPFEEGCCCQTDPVISFQLHPGQPTNRGGRPGLLPPVRAAGLQPNVSISLSRSRS